MPNLIDNVIQISGPQTSMQRILAACSDNSVEGIVPPRDNPKGRYNMQNLIDYTRGMPVHRRNEIMTWGSKCLTIDNRHVVYESDNETIKAIVLDIQSAWDPVVHWCQNIPDEGLSVLIAYKGEI